MLPVSRLLALLAHQAIGNDLNCAAVDKIVEYKSEDNAMNTLVTLN
jgi:GMP synthase PP-ATPase subunit